MRPPSRRRCYFAFEHSFPLPDTVLAGALISGGLNARKGRASGRALSLTAAGGLIFLGLIDLSFTAQNGGFSGPVGEALVSAFISLWCLVVATWILAVHGREPGPAAAVARR